MLYWLENDQIKISVDTMGGELHHITGKKEGTQYLSDGDPVFWKYHAPILFPIVGKLNDNTYTVEGKTYHLPQHGLARVREFQVVGQSANQLTFELSSSADTLSVYPYPFVLRIIYRLEGNHLSVTYEVLNPDSSTMYFSIGAHPAFHCPLEDGERFEDYSLLFDSKETASRIPLNADGLLKRDEIPFLDRQNTIPLSYDLFSQDALIFDSLKSCTVRLVSKNHKKGLVFDFSEFPYLGIWTIPDKKAPFICIEPWFGHADFEDFHGDFTQKDGVLSLDAGGVFRCTYSIQINQ
nr:aldose 1-epimerase family protein [uncultured Solibaculum sp.]